MATSTWHSRFVRFGSVLWALLAVASVRGQLCPDEAPLANHVGTSYTACPCFIPGEQAGAVFSLPPSAFPIEILEIRVGWGSQFGGSSSSTEQGLHVYQAGLPNPGTPVFTWPGPTLVDGILNRFDIESLPGQVVVNSAGSFTVTVEFLNSNFQNPFQGTVVYDGGCQSGKNAVFQPPASWSDACNLGVPGDFVFEVDYRQVTCARCPPVTLQHHTGPMRVELPFFIPADQVGSEFSIPSGDLPAEIVEVGVGWGSQSGVTPAQIEQGLHVYGAGLPNPGAPIFTLPGPSLVDGVINRFDLKAPPGAVVATSSPFSVTLEFLNQSSGNPAAPSVVHDNNGCQAGVNLWYDANNLVWTDICTAGVPGDLVFEATYAPISCVGAGRVPDGDLVPGTPLTVARAGGGGLQLDWDDSCDTGDTDYEIYEGTIGTYYSHVGKWCSTSGAKTETITPATGSTYYLVVPHDGTVEGSYGVDSENRQRPRLGNACPLSQQIGSCP